VKPELTARVPLVLGVAAGADDCPSMKERMSCLVMRPPRPVPETCDRFTPCSRAILRTSGEERASSSSGDPAAGGAPAVGAGVAAAAGSFASLPLWPRWSWLFWSRSWGRRLSKGGRGFAVGGRLFPLSYSLQPLCLPTL
jgi:hypothetical protein